LGCNITVGAGTGAVMVDMVGNVGKEEVTVTLASEDIASLVAFVLSV